MIDLELRWQLVTACHILADSGLNDYVWGHAAVRARDESGVWMKPADLGMGEVEEITFDWVDWYNNRRLHVKRRGRQQNGGMKTGTVQ